MILATCAASIFSSAMRLLESVTLQLCEFADDAIPKYAILSHTWGTEEVTFQDMRDGKSESKAGYSKIKNCAKQAIADGWGYIWVDTCCIDKTSSAELSEAINSMYQWYNKAEVCYAYLADVPSEGRPGSIPSTFRNSRWFTRGWTLQELIAPSTVVFYASDWIMVSSKADREMRLLVSEITGIQLKFLQGEHPGMASVAQRMSWAAKRETTRIEDRAYSLLGLFDVNMPLLYGEGKKSFIRLQEEIMEISDDQSLFAWKATEEDYIMSCQGLLAGSPAHFMGCDRITSYGDMLATTAYSMTNKGLQIELPLMPGDKLTDTFTAILNCKEHKDQFLPHHLGIYLKCFSAERNQFCRIKPNIISGLHRHLVSEIRASTVYIRRNFPNSVYDQDRYRQRKIYITDPPAPLSLSKIHPSHHDIKAVRYLNMTDVYRKAGLDFLCKRTGACFVVILSITPAGFCLSKVVNRPAGQTLREICEQDKPFGWSSSFWNERATASIKAKDVTGVEVELYVTAEIRTEKRPGSDVFYLKMGAKLRPVT
jgi:hypothetical protein